MNLKKIITAAMLSLVNLTAQLRAQENNPTYLNFEVKQTKDPSGNYQYRLLSSKISTNEPMWNVLHEHHPSVPVSQTLEIYDKGNNLIKAYEYQRDSIIFYDNFGNKTNPGGMIVRDMPTNYFSIPFNTNSHIFKIKYRGKSFAIKTN